MPAACPGDDELIGFVRGHLSAADAERVQVHVRSCELCSTAVAEVARDIPAGKSGAQTEAARADPLAVSADTLQPGDRLGRYSIIKLLGKGAMGAVYEAQDPQLHRRVAIKVLRPDTRARGGQEELQQRLLREAQAMARLSHPSVVAVHDVGAIEDRVFIAMERVEGVTLDRWLHEAPRKPELIVRVLAQAGRGLWAAHQAGLVHRDFKPDNVLVEGSGDEVRARVTDFGLSRVDDEDAPATAAPDERIEPASLTRTGALVGTPAYMAPEQLDGQRATPASDLFSFCVVLWEALYGARPFPSTTLLELRDSIRRGPPRTPPSPRVPARVRALLERGLAVEPAQRPASMAEVVAALEHDRSKQRLRLALGAAALLVAAVIGVAIHRERACAGLEQELAGAWGPAEHEALQKSFAARNTEWAQKALSGAVAALDRYAADWVQMKTQACESTRRRGAQPERILELRYGCLDLRRRELKSVVDRLAGSDEQLQRAAVKLAGALSSLSGCADVASLAAVVPPGDPDTQARVKELSGRLADLRVVGNAGRFAEADASAGKLAEEARVVGYQPLISEISLYQGEMQVYIEHHDSAQPLLSRAIHSAEAGNAAKLSAKGWQVLALSQNQKGDAAAAQESIAHASALVQGQGGDAELEASIAHTLGGIQLQRKQYAEATNTFLHVADLYRKIGSPEIQVGTALANAASARGSGGDREGAVELGRQSLAVYQRTLDEQHPRVLMGKINLAIQLMYLDRLEEAAPLAESVRANADEKAQPYPRALAEEVDAEIALRQGRAAEGLPLAQSALGRFEAMRGRENAQYTDVAYTLGRLFNKLGRFDEAEEVFRRSLAIDHKLGDKAGEAAQLTGISAALLGRGDAAGALAAAREAIALAEGTDDIEEKARAHLTAAAALAGPEPSQALAELALARPHLDNPLLSDRHLRRSAEELQASLGAAGSARK